MPIGGFVINCLPEDEQRVLEDLSQFPAVEVHGTDDKGHIVAVIDTETSEEMEAIVDQLEARELVLNVGAVYLHMEDEIDKLRSGEIQLTGRSGVKRSKSKKAD